MAAVIKEVKTRNQTKLASKKRCRIKIINDPTKYEEHKQKERERYHNRKKLITEMTQEEKMKQRLKWRQKYHKRKAKLKDDQQKKSCEKDGRLASGKKKRRRNTFKLKKKIKILEKKLENAKKISNRYRMKLQRKTEKKRSENSPQRTVENLIRGQNVTQAVKDNLLLGEVIKTQLKTNFQLLKDRKQKRQFCESISGKVVKKYKSLHHIRNLTSEKCMRLKNKRKDHFQKWKKIKNEITLFFEKDENSRLCPGKRDFISRKRIKKQKRYLNDCLKNLHKKFVKSHSELQISYQTFCRCKPFWIVPPVASKRDTCMCITHANISLQISRLKLAHVIEERTPQDLCKSLCCENSYLRDECLERICDMCRDKKLKPKSDFVKEDSIYFERWTSTTNKIIINNTEKLSRRTIKEKVLTTKGKLFENLEKSVEPFFLHVRNIQHQFKAIDTIKNDLKFNEILLHIDFSENYLCKYSEEVQAIHFGGSKTQLSLHTVRN